jgi:hypothetical protein
MTRHHVFARNGGAIVVAVVTLILNAVDVAAGHEPSRSKVPAAGNGPSGPAPTCHAWAAATRRANVKVGENARRDVTIRALARACNVIPEQLRRAAGEVQRVKDPREGARILATAASEVLGEGCAVAEPLDDARKVASTCPLPPPPSELPYRLEQAELMQLGAVDYLILNVMLRSLIAANQFDESAQRVILDFTLSAEISREDSQKREERRHRRP